MPTNTVNLLDVNPLERITGDIAISQHNYESIMNALVQWDNSRNDSITVRLATRTEPYFVDYVLHTKYYYDKNYGTINSAVLLDAGQYAYANRLKMPTAYGDALTLRINARNVGDTTWRMYYDTTVYDEVVFESYGNLANVYTVSAPSKFQNDYLYTGLYFRLYDESNKQFVLYKTLVPIAAGTTIPSDLSSLAVPVYTIGQNQIPPNLHPQNDIYFSDVATRRTLYIRTLGVPIDGSKQFSDPESGYELYCEPYDGNKIYTRGQLVYYKGDFFISLVDNPALPPIVFDTVDSVDTCEYHPEFWATAFPLPMNNKMIYGSGSIRLQSITDSNGIILRNVGEIASGEFTSISINGSITIQGSESCQPTGVNILPTSNYTNWPVSTATKWIADSDYITLASKSAFDKQDYSAVMTFNHYGDYNFKYKNIINYDGPDLDQGLCVMLPVTVTSSDNQTHDPTDGTIIEFLFNIWPNHKYDGRDVNDLIINKSQIYVYSVPDYSEYLQNGFNVNTVEPIAKFSMARLVNFYVYSENIGVPDRPVCYKARFIYSKKEHRWKTYDYYQFPDHIFLSPNGFVDPTDDKAVGVQSAGFPLFQNPFSDYDLSAIHVDERYRNQLQKPGEI